MNKKKFFLCFLSIFFSIIIFTGCTNNRNNSNEQEKTIVNLRAVVPNKSFVIGNIDLSEINIIVTYSDSSLVSIVLTDDMIVEKDKEKLTMVGNQEIQIIYSNMTTKMYIKLVESKEIYYTVSVVGGYISSVNGSTIVNPIIPNNGEAFVESYPLGTELIINWRNYGGYNFDYWTINEVKSFNMDSIATVVVNGDVSYRAYSSAIGKTVSFVTGFDGLSVRSKTTEVLNLSNIEKIEKIGYVFLGWTTDVITEEQAHNAYDKNLVAFPYQVTRDIVFFGVWTPIEINYTEVDGGYAVTEFNGNVTDFKIPNEYNGKPVVQICTNAFNTENGKFITKLRLPDTLRIIEDGSFRTCSHLESITINGDSDYFACEDGILFDKEKKQLLAYPAAKICDIYYVPNYIEKIVNYTFYDASIAGIVLGTGIKSIGNYSFYSPHIDYVDFNLVNASGLRMGDNLFHGLINKIRLAYGKEDAFNVFYQINELTTKNKAVTSKDELTEIGLFETIEGDGRTSKTVYRVITNDNFENKGKTAEILFTTRNLSRYTLQVRIDGYIVTSLAEKSFEKSFYLNDFTIPVGTRLERISDDVFSDTLWVKKLENNVIKSQDDTVVFKYLGNKSVFKLNRNTEKIAEGAFANNKNLMYLDISENAALKNIAAYGFFECKNFKGFIWQNDLEGETVFLKKNIKKVGAYAFYKTAIKDVVLEKENSVEHNLWDSIGEYAFAFCDKLQSVQFAKPINDIAETAFVGCYALEKFILTEDNEKFKVFDGILYELNGEGYKLFAYPAGRIDGEFNPSIRRNYSTSEIVKNEKNFLQTSSLTGDGESIGNIYFNGIKYEMYMQINGFKTSELNVGDDGMLYHRGKLLTETTDYDENGKPNGEKFYYFYNSESKRINLYYDSIKDNYYYIEHLNVKTLGDYSLFYSNIAALYISDSIVDISEYALKIPGLIYIKFANNPNRSYFELFDEFQPDFVVLPDNIPLNLKGIFYEDNKKLIENKDKSRVNYSFFYSFDINLLKYDYDVLYAYDYDKIGDVNTYVTRTSRSAETIVVEENIYMPIIDEGEISYICVSDSGKKKIVFPYSFYGGNIKTVFLRNVDELRDNAFSGAYNMEKLDVNTAFINNLGENVFGEKFNNGLFVYDYINGIDLYRSNYRWGFDFFVFNDKFGKQYASKYLIQKQDGAFAVITYVDNAGIEQTVEIIYGEISENDDKNITDIIQKKGYKVAFWTTQNGQIINVGENFSIPYNMILKCNFEQEVYDVYLYSSPLVKFDMEQYSVDESGLIVYKTQVKFDEEYSFIPSENNSGKYIFLKLSDNTIVNNVGVWDNDDGTTIDIMVVFGYKLHFDCKNGNAIFENEYKYVFNGSDFDLGFPESIDGSVFKGWAYKDENNNHIMLTDASGKSLQVWQNTEQNDFEVYAEWES